MSAASTSTSPASGASAVSDLLATTTPDGHAARERRVERAFGGAGTATTEAALVCFGVAFYLGAAPAGASFFLLLAIFTEIALALPKQRARAPPRIW